MSDSSDETPTADAAEGDAQAGTADDAAPAGARAAEREDGAEEGAGDRDLEALRDQVERNYDFDDFGPQDMAEMSPEEWGAAFDSEAWVTGAELLDRVEADVRSRIASRDVFAVLERAADPPRLVAYSDKSYAVVYDDGTIEGEGAVLRDVKPTVALASMPEYDVPEDPPDAGLPAPEAIETESSSLGNLMLQLVGGAMLVSALVLFGATLLADLGGATIVAVVVGFVFLAVGVALTVTVANARLSSRYRAEEYRDRLRGAGVQQGERPAFLPVDDEAFAATAAELERPADGDGGPPDDGTEAEPPEEAGADSDAAASGATAGVGGDESADGDEPGAD